jgi:hypothetical protein
MECGVEFAVTEFSPSYRRASVMQAILADLGLLSSIVARLAGATFWWLIAGALLGSNIPSQTSFTVQALCGLII